MDANLAASISQLGRTGVFNVLFTYLNEFACGLAEQARASGDT